MVKATAAGVQLRLSRSTWDAWRPRRGIRSWDWICQHARMPDGSLFDPYSYPWAEGVCDEFDNPRRRNFWLQWGSRVGKTALVHSILLFVLATNPCEALFSSSVQTLAGRIVAKKLWPMIDRCRELAPFAPAKSSRSNERLDLLNGSTVYTAWGGSASTLADLDARFGHAGEVDKWPFDKKTEEEGDPLGLFLERLKNNPDAKAFIESTPGRRKTSRVEAGRLKSTNCQYQVPCPRCNFFQVLRFFGTGDPDDRRGGVIWDHLPDGSSDPDLARETARYRCIDCAKEIHDEHRRPMFAKGVWVPDGCWVDKKGRLKGTPKRDGPDWGSQLSSLYSATQTWGSCAAKWVDSKDSPRKRQIFFTNWIADTWAGEQQQQSWEELGDRLGTERELGIVPREAHCVTVGVDVQVDVLVYVAVAWNRESTAWVIDYGFVDTWDELTTEVLDRQYEHEAGGKMGVSLALVDSRYHTNEVYGYCKHVSRPRRWVMPCMGQQSSSMKGQAWRKTSINTDSGKRKRKTRRRGLSGDYVIDINHTFWQDWLQWRLDVATPGAPGSLQICAEAAVDQDFLEQLLNETETWSARNKRTYEQVDDQIPVDYRDCTRMARVAVDVFTRGKLNRMRTYKPPGSKAKQEGSSRPKGKRRGAIEGPFGDHLPR